MQLASVTVSVSRLDSKHSATPFIYMRSIILILIAATLSLSLHAEVVAGGALERYNLDFGVESLERSIDSIKGESPSSFRFYKLISPASPIVLGSLTLYVTNVDDLDMSWSDEISSGHGKLTFDDYMQYSPVLIMWGLNAFGNIEPYHKFKQQTTILAMASLTSLALVQGTKTFVKRRRPDTGATNSFPSGHTATAFLCAEMLHQEYGHHSPWISITGYSIAAFTGYMRVYNERHYIGDIVAGAGFGMLSARLAYWLAPRVNEFLWGSSTGYQSSYYASSIAPCTLGDGVGINLSISF